MSIGPGKGGGLAAATQEKEEEHPLIALSASSRGVVWCVAVFRRRRTGGSLQWRVVLGGG